MTEQNGLRIGVLGTGWGTRISVPALRAEGWHVAALWSRNAERASKSRPPNWTFRSPPTTPRR